MTKDEWANCLIQKKRMVTGAVVAKNKKYVEINDDKLVYDDGEVTDISSQFAPFHHYCDFPFFKKNILFGFIAEFHDVNKFSIHSENEEMNIMLELLIEDVKNNFVSLPESEFAGSDYLNTLNSLVETNLFHTKEITIDIIKQLFDYLVVNPNSNLPNPLKNYFKNESFKNGSNTLYWEDVEIVQKSEKVKVFKIAYYDKNNVLIEDNCFYENSEDFIKKFKEKNGLDGSQIIKFEKLPYTEIAIEKNKYYEILK